MRDTASMMRLTIAAMLPAVAAVVYVYGVAALWRVLLAAAAAALAEAACLRLRGLSWRGDGSAVIAGMIIGLSLPPLTAWFVPVSASLFAIVLAKHCYGGLGNNPFNPAMAGYALAFVSFPAHFAGWQPEADWGLAWESLFADAVSAPTALTAARLNLPAPPPIFLPVIAAAVGGIALLLSRAADWRLTVAFLIAAAAVNALFGGEMADLLAGGLVFAAFFVITDPVTAARTPFGRCLYGALVGGLVVCLRHRGMHADAIAFAVLIGNMIAPLCDMADKRGRRS